MLALFLSPPETPLIYVFPILVFEQLVNPNSLMSDSTLYAFSAGVMVNLIFAEK